MLAYGSDVWSVCWMYIQAERQRAELQRELATLGDHVDEANEATRSQVAPASAAATAEMRSAVAHVDRVPPGDWGGRGAGDLAGWPGVIWL